MEELTMLIKKRKALRIPPKSRMKRDAVYFRKGVSEEDYFDLSTEDDKWELLNATLIIHSPASPRHQLITQFLGWILMGYVRHKDLGAVWYAPTTLHLATSRNVEPDIFFIHKDNPVRRDELCLTGIPDLVIEVTARARRRYDLGRKLEEYQRAKVREIWIVDYERERLHRYWRVRGRYKDEVIESGRVYSKVVEGFWVDASWLWSDPPPNELWALEQIEMERNPCTG
ncbi:MAG TPA: Uma2 family endonuclease [Armatimonadetes bacterium]|nr:Uma2 family endonuclease [Armatimonadota bacterium]